MSQKRDNLSIKDNTECLRREITSLQRTTQNVSEERQPLYKGQHRMSKKRDNLSTEDNTECLRRETTSL